MGMVVATGVGGGLILDGRVDRGRLRQRRPHRARRCRPGRAQVCGCGARGCLEAIARGPALAAWAQGQGWRPDQPGATAKELAGDAAQGHPIAPRRDAPGRAGPLASRSRRRPTCATSRWSRSAAASPRPGALLFDPLEESLREHARLPFARRVSVVPAALGQSAGLVGAAALHPGRQTATGPATERWGARLQNMTTTSARPRVEDVIAAREVLAGSCWRHRCCTRGCSPSGSAARCT